MAFKKRRIVYFILILLIVPLGLATRKRPEFFYPFIAEYGGDAFWSTMFFFLFRIWQPGQPAWKIALYTFLFSVAVELSQLYHAEWIDKIRDTFLGKMLLGNTFYWSDIACYFAGTLLGWGIAVITDKYTQPHL